MTPVTPPTTDTEPADTTADLFSIPRWEYTDEDGITADVVWLNDAVQVVQVAAERASGQRPAADAESGGLDVERWKEAWIEHRRRSGADELHEPCTPNCTSLIAEELG